MSVIPADPTVSQLERRVFHLSTLLEVAETLNNCRTRRDIFAGVLAVLAGTFGASRALALARDEEGRWHCAATRGEPEASQVSAVLAPRGLLPGEHVLATATALVADGAAQEHVAVAVLSTAEQTHGAFILGPRLLHEPYVVADHELLHAIAGYTARALENLRLYEALQEAQEKLRLENLALREAVKRDFSTGLLLGQSAAMQQVLAQVRSLGKSDANVLITGETGTGKELVARALHHHSPRADGPFIGINCTAIPENLVETEFFGIEAGTATGVKRHLGLFEQAHGGTLFIDEVGDMPAASQAKLLRVLQERKLRRVGGDREISVNVRVLAATNKNLRAEIAAGRLREDLYYRLAVLEIHLPPLRERREDIALLAHHFLRTSEEQLQRRSAGFAPELLHALEQYDWPGNVRELENEIERLVTLAEPGQRLSLEQLSPKFHRPELTAGKRTPPATRLREAVDQLERDMIATALAQHGHNKSRTARALGVSRLGLQHKMERLGLAGRSDEA